MTIFLLPRVSLLTVNEPAGGKFVAHQIQIEYLLPLLKLVREAVSNDREQT
jgi:hypothetical protein